MSSVLNVNVGVLGHVDSGKTSLVAALSTTLATAALDKHPQSKERGITLDLGFSSFTVAAPEHIRAAGYDSVQFTLVDCPGHASLIRTIIGGAQIIDMMILVVDVTKGIQTQTAECIVIGEVATNDMVVVLNKTDLLPAEKRERYIKKAQKMVAQTLASTKFAGAPQVAVAAAPGAGPLAAQAGQAAVPAAAAEGPGQLPSAAGDLSSNGSTSTMDTAPGSSSSRPEGVEALVQQLLSRVRPRQQAGTSAPFLFYVDHCFAIKGQGTVLTGTAVRGTVKVGDTLELPELKLQRKVKSMQVFRQPVQSCGPGDRAGICVTQLSAKLIERGIACAPGSVPTFESAVAAVEKIRFYGSEVRSRSKMHVTVGPSTVMADLLFFGLPDGQGLSPAQAMDSVVQSAGRLSLQSQQGQRQQQGAAQAGSDSNSSAAGAAAGSFQFSREYVFQEELYGLEGRPAAASSKGTGQGAAAGYIVQGTEDEAPPHFGPQWCYLRFAQPVTAPADSLVIGSKLDADLHGSACRLAFYGRLCAVAAAGSSEQAQQQQQQQQPQQQQQRQPNQQRQPDTQLQRQLRIYKLKQREGSIERVEADGGTAICRGMFQKETDLSHFTGLQVVSGCGQMGRIEGGFGKSGKFRVYFPGGVEAQGPSGQPTRVVLTFKRFLFDSDRRRIVQ